MRLQQHFSERPAFRVNREVQRYNTFAFFRSRLLAKVNTVKTLFAFGGFPRTSPENTYDDYVKFTIPTSMSEPSSRSPAAAVPNQDHLVSMIDHTPKQVAPDVFVLRAVFRMFPGLLVPATMTIIRNAKHRTLLVYSPLNPALYADLSPLGVVTAIVAPSAMHSTYAQIAKSYYPTANLYSAPTLKLKFPDRDWGVVITPNTAHNILGSHIRVQLVSLCPQLTEITLLHLPSETLVVCDLAFNFTKQILTHASWLARIYIRLTGAEERPLEVSSPIRFMIRPHCTRSLPMLDALLEQPWTRVIPCHGDVVEDAKPKFIQGVYKFVKDTARKQEKNQRVRNNRGNVFQLVVAIFVTLCFIAFFVYRFS